jgi:hypothetical protein
LLLFGFSVREFSLFCPDRGQIKFIRATQSYIHSQISTKTLFFSRKNHISTGSHSASFQAMVHVKEAKHYAQLLFFFFLNITYHLSLIYVVINTNVLALIRIP